MPRSPFLMLAAAGGVLLTAAATLGASDRPKVDLRLSPDGPVFLNPTNARRAHFDLVVE